MLFFHNVDFIHKEISSMIRAENANRINTESNTCTNMQKHYSVYQNDESIHLKGLDIFRPYEWGCYFWYCVNVCDIFCAVLKRNSVSCTIWWSLLFYVLCEGVCSTIWSSMLFFVLYKGASYFLHYTNVFSFCAMWNGTVLYYIKEYAIFTLYWKDMLFSVWYGGAW